MAGVSPNPSPLAFKVVNKALEELKNLLNKGLLAIKSSAEYISFLLRTKANSAKAVTWRQHYPVVSFQSSFQALCDICK